MVFTFGLFGYKTAIIEQMAVYFVYGFTGISIKYNYDEWDHCDAFYLGHAMGTELMKI